jgi:hypothetical protein
MGRDNQSWCIKNCQGALIIIVDAELRRAFLMVHAERFMSPKKVLQAL